MSKALPIAVAVILGGAALVPVYYATKHPAPAQASSVADKNATPVQKISYILGYDFANQIPPDMDINAFNAGTRDGHAHKPSAYSQEELKAAVTAYQGEVQKKQLEQSKKIQSLNDTFLIDNAKKPGVKTTASGLQYKITREGQGKQPNADSVVKVNYKGMLADGTVFDSSYQRGQAAEFSLKQVIPGWSEGLQLLKAGGAATLYIPAKLAYGEQSMQGIPPNSTLVFDVELLEVK